MKPPPFFTFDLPGTGGRLKSTPADFIVREIPLYEPTGAGEHVFVTIERADRNTADLARALAQLFGLNERAVGTAGRKDRRAIVTQTFSLFMPGDRRDANEIGGLIAARLGLRVFTAARHANKLRTGHLQGNEFEIVIRDVVPDAQTRAQAVLAVLGARGLPNYFGLQRFGRAGENIQRGRDVLKRKIRPRRDLADLYVSALQSDLFNQWLSERTLRGDFERLLPGDVAKREDSGGLFDVADAAQETGRLARGDITYTGPLFGHKMRRATEAAREFEDATLAAAGLKWNDFRPATGARRVARLRLPDVDLAAEADALRLRFTLPKGAYATVLLREIIKSDDSGENNAEPDDG